MFRCMVADYGPMFTKQFDGQGISQNAWQHRLYGKVSSCKPDAIIDGYEISAKAKPSIPPTLAEISDAITRINSERTRTAEHIAEVSAPRVNGLAGYVEHLAEANPDNTLALGCIETMREILSRPSPATAEERNARIDKAMQVHARVMATAPRINHRGQVKKCPVPGCGKRGAIARTTHSDGESTEYFCAEHFRNG